jgi:2-polyprenyl-6-methoxyphenol hydroxylase-like FAD-dependent oxidoreductase
MVTHTPVDVVVAGGGIGGLANALALARKGQRVRVLERAAEFAEVGAGLQMAPNATRILREWGLLERVLDAGVSPKRLVFKDAIDGGELTHLPLDDVFGERYSAPYVVIHRSDLLEILHDACLESGVELISDSTVAGVEQYVDGVVVQSSTGDHPARVVLGADGLRSRLRATLSDDEPICSGYVAYRGAFPVGELGRELEPSDLTDVVVHMGPGCHLVQYALRGGEMCNTVAVFSSPAYHRGEHNWGGPEELDEVFAACTPEVRRGITSLWRTRQWPMYDRLPIDNWVDGRLALTGDAAHPMLQYLAQGACQALEDAAFLAGQVDDAAGEGAVDWPVALKEYERVRTVRTAEVQTKARVWGELWHVDGLPRIIRNELFSDRDPQDFRHVDWLYG